MENAETQKKQIDEIVIDTTSTELLSDQQERQFIDMQNEVNKLIFKCSAELQLAKNPLYDVFLVATSPLLVVFNFLILVSSEKVTTENCLRYRELMTQMNEITREFAKDILPDPSVEQKEFTLQAKII